MTTWLNILPIFNGPRLVVAERAEYVSSALAARARGAFLKESEKRLGLAVVAVSVATPAESLACSASRLSRGAVSGVA